MPTPSLSIIPTRLRNQRLTGAGFASPVDVVRWMGAVQAQEYADAQWGLALRTKRATQDVIERAFTDGTILRTHVLRPTWHFVVPQDIRWMLALTGPYVSKRMAPYNRSLELDASVFRRSQSVIARALRGGTFLTRQELKRILQSSGIDAAGVQRLAHIVMQAELDGVVCSGPRRGRQFTYALLDDRVSSARTLSRTDALVELTRRYFTSHGPAQLQDFAWWSGLPIGEARTGLALLEDELVREEIEGTAYWWMPSTRSRDARPMAYLLPIYDEYLIAYKDRRAAFERTRWAQTTAGDPFSAPVVLNGRVVGAWRKRISSPKVIVSISLYTRLTKADSSAIHHAALAYADFVGAELDLVCADPPSRQAILRDS